MKRLIIEVVVPNTKLKIKKAFAAEASSLTFLPTSLGTEHFLENVVVKKKKNVVVYLEECIPWPALNLGNSI